MYVKQNDASRLIHMMTQLDISYSIWGVRVQIANFRGEIGNLGGKLAIWGAKELIRNLGFLAAIWKGPNCRVFHRLSLFRLLCGRKKTAPNMPNLRVTLLLVHILMEQKS